MGVDLLQVRGGQAVEHLLQRGDVVLLDVHANRERGLLAGPPLREQPVVVGLGGRGGKFPAALPAVGSATA